MATLALFEIAGRTFALPSGALHKVVHDGGPVTRVPFMPADVEGLVSIGGVIVAQIDLGCRLGLTPNRDEPSVLLLTNIAGRLVALRVTRVLSNADIDDDAIKEPSSAAGSLIAGTFWWQARRVSLLRLGQVGLDGVTPVAIGRPTAVLGCVAPRHRTEPSQAGAAVPPPAAPPAFLVVRCGGDAYAIPLEHLQEVVTIHHLTAIPRAPAEILGLTAHRGKPLAVLSLARLLGRVDGDPKKGRTLAVVRYGAGCVALAVDVIVGMRALETTDWHSMAQPRNGVAGYHLSRDHVLTGLLDVATLLDSHASGGLMAFLPVARNDGAPGRNQPERERRFLTFRMGDDLYGMDIDHVERIAEHRTPQPLPGQRRGALVGMIEVGGRVVPVADLRRPCGGPPLVTRRTAYVLARGARGVWAVVVDGLARIVRAPVSAIRSAGNGSHFIAEIVRIDQALMPIVDPKALDSLAA